MKSGLKCVFYAREDINIPEDRILRWGYFHSDCTHHLDIDEGKIYFPMVYSNMNIISKMILSLSVILVLIISFLASLFVFRRIKSY